MAKASDPSSGPVLEASRYRTWTAHPHAAFLQTFSFPSWPAASTSQNPRALTLQSSEDHPHDQCTMSDNL